MTSPDPAVVQAVSNSPFGRTLSPSQIASLAGLTKLLIHRPHDILAHEGTVDPQVFCVVDGSLDVVKHLGTPDETVLATLHAGVQARLLMQAAELTNYVVKQHGRY